MDRNIRGNPYLQIGKQSLSARRAWIEIVSALIIQSRLRSSLSARRAWIEIRARRNWHSFGPVALRKESVDRNDDLQVPDSVSKESLSARRAWIEIGVVDFAPDEVFASLSARRAWIEIARPTTRTQGQCRRSPQGERG